MPQIEAKKRANIYKMYALGFTVREISEILVIKNQTVRAILRSGSKSNEINKKLSENPFKVNSKTGKNRIEDLQLIVQDDLEKEVIKLCKDSLKTDDREFISLYLIKLGHKLN